MSWCRRMLEQKIENEEISGILSRLRDSRAFKWASDLALPILAAGWVGLGNVDEINAESQYPEGIHCESRRYCENPGIRIECSDDGCYDNVMLKHLQVQNQVYDCLQSYFKFHPSDKIIYSIRGLGKLDRVTSWVSGGKVVCSGEADGKKIENFECGKIESGSDRVTDPNNVMADINRTTHVFMDDLSLPGWLEEGIIAYVSCKVQCHPTQDDGYTGCPIPHATDYHDLKISRTSLNGALKEDKAMGAMFMVGLTEDYGCGSKCVSEFVRSLHKLAVKKHVRIDNLMIKQEAEKAARKDLTPLFNLLEIKY